MNKAVQILLGIIFLSAALFRTFNYPAAKLELSNMGIPGPASILVILIELTIAACFLTHRFVKYASLAAAVFLTVPIGISVFLYPEDIYSQLSDLFVFNATATDVVLHIVFFVLVVLIFITERNKGDREAP